MKAPDFRFFFTDEDPRELPKGSRDPLRFIPVWASAGRKLIPYLTTVTPSYRGFLTRFLFHGAIELYESPLVKGSSNDQWEAFCRFEQLCALVRSNLEPKTPWLPGSTSIVDRVRDGKFVVGAHSSYWLGKSQKTTGFWGYYHQACRGSGLVQLNKADRPGYVLTETARHAFNRSMLPVLLTQLRAQLEEVFKRSSIELHIEPFGDLAAYFHRRPIDEPGMTGFWSQRLLMPDANYPSGALQQDFAQRLQATMREAPGTDTHSAWESLCAGHQQDAVAANARQVRATEAVIGLSEWVFDVCRLRFEGENTLTSAREWAISNGYGPDWLDLLRTLEQPRDQELREIRDIALNGQQDSFIPVALALLARHEKIMCGRGGTSWVSVDGYGHLNIREPVADVGPFTIDKYPTGVRWRYDYFLRSWLTAAREIGYIPEAPVNA